MKMNHKRCKGFTLIEVMISVAVIGTVLGVAYKVMDSQQKAATAQSEVVAMQEGLRAAVYYMEREIRLAGYPLHSEPFNASTGNVSGTGIIEAGHGHIRVAMDIFDKIDNDVPPLVPPDIDEWDEDSTAPLGTSFNDGKVDALNEDITFGFDPTYDTDQDGQVDVGAPLVEGTDRGAAPLGRLDFNNPPYIDLAESIEAIAFAYAFDANDDGQLDFLDVNGNGVQEIEDLNGNGIQDPGERVDPTIWAVDSNVPADNTLDTILDTNGPLGIPDGFINDLDPAGGAPMGYSVGIDKIRAVKVWILARTKHPVAGFRETRTFVVGDKRITPNDRYQRRLFTTTVNCRNLRSLPKND